MRRFCLKSGNLVFGAGILVEEEELLLDLVSARVLPERLLSGRVLALGLAVPRRKSEWNMVGFLSGGGTDPSVKGRRVMGAIFCCCVSRVGWLGGGSSGGNIYGLCFGQSYCMFPFYSPFV